MGIYYGENERRNDNQQPPRNSVEGVGVSDDAGVFVAWLEEVTEGLYRRGSPSVEYEIGIRVELAEVCAADAGCVLELARRGDGGSAELGEALLGAVGIAIFEFDRS